MIQPLHKPALWLLVALIAPVLMLVLITRFAVNVPFEDQWTLVPLMMKVHTGGFTIGDFWNQYVHSRMAVFRLILIALARIGGWDMSREPYLSFAAALLSLVVIWRLLTAGVRPALVGPLVAIASWVIFSASQSVNWIWGFQFSLFLPNLLALVAIAVLAHWPGRWWSLAIALVATVTATFTFTIGLMIWPTILVGLVVQRRIWGWRAIVLWLAAAAVTIGLYLYGYTWVLAPNRDTSLPRPLALVLFVLAYLGDPLAYGHAPELSAMYGLLGLIMLAFVVLKFRRSWYGALRLNDLGDRATRTLPWIQLALFALLNGCLTAWGRVGFGLAVATSFHYTTGPILFWIGAPVALIIALQDAPPLRFTRARPLAAVLVGAAVLFIVGGYLAAYRAGYQDMSATSYRLRLGQTFLLYDLDTAPDVFLNALGYESDTVRVLAKALRTYREGPFAEGSQAPLTWLRLANLRNEIGGSQEAPVVRPYPPTLVEMTLGDKSSLRRDGDTLEFTSTGALGTNLYFDLVQPNILPSAVDPVAVDVQSRKAQLINIYWNTGRGLNELETTSSQYGILDKDGQRHFTLFAPTGVQGFRIDLYYSHVKPVVDRVKVILIEKKPDATRPKSE